ncbi:LysR family transcriptional regulator [Flagellimonas meishanensis]|uniref:LysR family transcriptional regulator n=1 Tax=Flagellimonas meishanensis TaxID=2873264 RepID=UPI001CA72744|nr:LysR family transcriptional regulator [[Muricauda] meishanensis]
MEIRHLRLVVEVHKLGTLSKASEVLCLSQSALSHQLKEFEAEVGMVVFHRVNKRLVISETGEVVLRYAKLILKRLEELNSSLMEIKGEEKGSIRISLEAYTSYYWFPSILRKFHKTYPNIEITINTENSTRPLHLLESNNLDFAIMVYQPSESYFESVPVLRDELVVVLPNSHILSKRNYLEARDFVEEVIITHSGKNQKDKVLEKAFGAKEINPLKYIHIGNTQSILEMVNEGLGVAILSKWAISKYIGEKKLKLIKFGKNGTFRNWYWVYLKNRNLSKFEKYFLDVLRGDFELYKPDF